MTEQQTSYRQIMKATSLFGGVQIFQILISIIRSKFVAILLGPTGMGIAGLLGSTTGLIGGLTNFGLSTSAVKDISEANATGDDVRLKTVVSVFRKIVWITGSLGLILTMLFSPMLSQYAFGNKNYTIAFILISVTLLFSQINSSHLVLLQGLRKLQYLAKASLIGSILGLMTTIPLYYLYGNGGIIPGIIITSLTMVLISYYFSKKLDIKSIKVSNATLFAEGKNMLLMGFMISLSGLLQGGAAYLVRIYISRTGGVDQVGLYSSGFTIISTYVGLVFSAMSTDYFPRLSAVSKNNLKCKTLINQQAEIAVLILAPLIVIFIVYSNSVILLLYSKQFLTISNMVKWSAIGMLFKAASWSIGFVFLSKGKTKIFFWSEFTATFYNLVLSILGYKYYGLDGLGISFLIGFIFFLIQVYLISKIKFKFEFDYSFIKIFIFQLVIIISCFIAVKYITQPISYIVGSLFFLISGWYSFRELDKKIGLINLIGHFKK